MISRFIQSLSVIFVLVMACTASYGVQYNIAVVDISNPRGINNRGQVVGQHVSNGVWSAAVWSRLGTTTLKPIGSSKYSDASDINDLGQLVGLSDRSGAYWENTSASAVVITSPNSTRTQANGMNDNGEVTGYTSTSVGSRAFYWKDGTLTVLGTLGGTTSWACEISNKGQIFGYADSASSKLLPCVWQDSNIRQLQRLSGYEKGSANNGNELGEIVGRCIDAAGNDRACYWSSDTAAPVDLGILSGAMTSQAQAINEHGQIVGLSYDTSFVHAVLWENGVIHDLNDLIAADSGWELRRAEDINDYGQIVGIGYLNGREQTFILTPVPEPSSLSALLCGVCAISGMARLRRK